MTSHNIFKNVLYDSEDDISDIKQIDCVFNENLQSKMFKPKKKRLYCTVLTKEEVELLEREFITRNLKLNKSNVKKLAKELNLPHKKSIDYFMRKIKNASEDIRSDKYIKEVKEINQEIEKSWEKYKEGCDKYKM